ncbi:MAG: Lrp/AsnC ligand binding domain-containing protein [Candidatus Thermoplasmatota archaeon]|nr:Lrp/AsnC ligand binding domain-containing protein [Candidatus Thermoplasmatota archaeon]
MPEAFVLLKTLPAREREVYQTLSNHDSVVEVHALYGEFDLLARVSSKDSMKLSSMLMSDFRQIDGVKDTQTLIAVEY